MIARKNIHTGDIVLVTRDNEQACMFECTLVHHQAPPGVQAFPIGTRLKEEKTSDYEDYKGYLTLSFMKGGPAKAYKSKNSALIYLDTSTQAEPFGGTVINTDNNFNVGLHMKAWRIENFKLFYGSVSLVFK